MRNKLFFMLLVFVFYFAGCSPEDGLCQAEKHSGDKDFNCSEADKYFSTSGNSLLEKFRSEKLVYSATYLLGKSDVPSSDSVIVEKPEYMPSTIEIEKMSKCSIAPSIGGIDCDQWYSFTFVTSEKDLITFSSRNGDKISETLTLKYVFFDRSGLSLVGYSGNNELHINDETVIDENIYQTKHVYLMIEK